MKLSVCIFTYNHKDFISEAIESVLMQNTNFDFEIVIGEDFSTDGTRQIVRDYQDKYPEKIRAIFNQRNLGMMENNMNTIMQCQGEFIALLDGDDYWISDQKLQKQVEFLEANDKYAMCFHDGKVLLTDGTMHEKTLSSHVKKTEIVFTDIICDVSIPTFSLVFRSVALADYPPKWFKTLNAPDRPLFLMLSHYGPAYLIREAWGVYRMHANGSWTSQNYQSRWLTHLQIFKHVNKHYNNTYKEAFCRCEGRICFILAIELIRNNRFLRARCIMRKFIRINKGLFKNGKEFRSRLLTLIYFYCKKKYLVKHRG